MKSGKLHLVESASIPLNTAWRTGTLDAAGRKQVAAVCYRISGGKVDFLLVRTRKGRWIFPKGGVEPGLTHAESAALEAMEEAGVHGQIEEAPFASYTLRKTREHASPPVKAYLCLVVRTEAAQEPYRTPTWFSERKAPLRLRENRPPDDAAEFARMIGAALSRIRRLQTRKSTRKDALRRVHFESSAAAEEIEASSFIRSLKSHRGEIAVKIPYKTGRAKLLQLGRGPVQR